MKRQHLPDLERGGVHYGRMMKRLAISERDVPWEMANSSALPDVIERLERATTTLNAFLDQWMVDPALDPHFLNTQQAERYRGRTVSETVVEQLAETWELLEDIDRDLPAVMCWCVVKVYGRDPDTWRPTVWTGHTTLEQAEAFAPAIAAHYAKKSAHGGGDKNPDAPGHFGGWQDRFMVKRTPCSIRDMMQPALTPEDYVRSLG